MTDERGERPPEAGPARRAAARGGLGRGLEALIPRAPAGLQELELGRIAPNPRQPRQAIDPDGLAELADSIRQHGVIQPVVVTRAPDGPTDYVLVAGERRWRAARQAGLRSIPALVKETAPRQRLELALVENIQRQDLTPLELAAAYRALIDEHGLTQEQVARRVGRGRATVANTLRLLQLPEPARAALADGQISEGHARALLGAPDDQALLACLDEVLGRGLTVRQTEALVRRAEAAPPASEASAAPPDPEVAHLEEQFRRALGTKVQLVRAGRGGRLIVHFYSADELEGIYRAICGEP